MDTPSFESELDVERLLASPTHVAWVRALAARLVRDESDRDDATQDSLLATWVRRASVQFPRAFAAVYLRSAGAHAARGRNRRASRERRAIRAEAAIDPARLVEQADLYGLLIRKLALLDEPFRAALIQRYVDDLEPKEIARRAGVPAATIRSRLQRGLEKLRAELDAAHGGDRDTWVRAFIVLLPARIGATSLVATPLAAGLVLFAAFLLADESPLAQVDAASVGATQRATASADAADARPDAAEAREFAASDEIDDAQRTALTDRANAASLDAKEPRAHHVVACDLGGRPIPGARVSLFASNSARDRELVGAGALSTAFAGQDGHATLLFDADMLEVADRTIRVEQFGFATRTFEIQESSAEQRLPLYDAPTDRLMCEVVDADGKPVADASISFPWTDGLDVRSDAHGRFEVLTRSAAAKILLRVRVPGALAQIEPLGASLQGLRVLTLAPTRPLTVTTIDATAGVPVADATWSEATGIDAFSGSVPDAIGRTDAAGAMTLEIPVSPTRDVPSRSLVVTATGYALAFVRWQVDDVDSVTVAIERAASVRGVVRDAQTRAPLAFTRVLLRVNTVKKSVVASSEPKPAIQVLPPVFPSRGVVVRTDAAGRFERDGLPASGRITASIVGDPNYEPSAVAVDLVPAGAPQASIEVAAVRRLVEDDGRVAGVMSFNGTLGPMPFRWKCATRSGEGHADEQGHYSIDGLPAGTLDLTTMVPQICSHEDQVSVRDGETTWFDVAVTSPLSHTGGRLLAADGSVAPFTLLTFSWERTQEKSAKFEYVQGQAVTDAQGRFEVWLPVDDGTALLITTPIDRVLKSLHGIAGEPSLLLVLPAAEDG